MPTPSPRAPRRTWWAMVLLAALPGCDKLMGAIEDKAEEVSHDAQQASADPGPLAPGAALTDDELLSQKLALYIECTQRASSRIRDSWARYDEHVKEDGTPRKRGTQPFLYKINSELTPCADAVVKGPTMEPPLPAIEKSMETYLEHARAFASTSVELDTYYEQEAYADDDWAKGKALAPGFAAAFDAWAEADDQLGALIETRKDVVDRNLLALVEQRKGKDIEWHSRHYMLEAKAYMHCVTALADAEAPKGKAPKPDVKACEPSLAALEQAGDEFRAYYDAHKEAADAVFWMTSFERALSDYLEEAKKLQSAPGKGSASAEQLDELVEKYDGLLSDSNNLRFDG